MPEIQAYTKAGADQRFETKTNASNLYVPKSNFNEMVEDVVAMLLVAGGTLTLAYDDNFGKLTITGTGTDAEAVRDTIGAALIGANGLTVALNDAADTITLSLDSSVVKTGDARLSDARTPKAHAATHATGGSDPITPASIGALAVGGKAFDSDRLDGFDSTQFAFSGHSHASSATPNLVGANGFVLSKGRYRSYGNANYLGFTITTPNTTLPAAERMIGTTNIYDSTGDLHGPWTIVGSWPDNGSICISPAGSIYLKHASAFGVANLTLTTSVSWVS